MQKAPIACNMCFLVESDPDILEEHINVGACVKANTTCLFGYFSFGVIIIIYLFVILLHTC